MNQCDPLFERNQVLSRRLDRLDISIRPMTVSIPASKRARVCRLYGSIYNNPVLSRVKCIKNRIFEDRNMVKRFVRIPTCSSPQGRFPPLHLHERYKRCPVPCFQFLNVAHDHDLSPNPNLASQPLR